MTGQIDQGVQDLSGQIMADITQALGIKDVYNLFLNKLCEGYYVDANDPHSAVRITRCSTYDDEFAGLRNITRSIPSSFQLGTTTATIPLIAALARTTDSLTRLVSAASLAMQALLILACLGAGLTAALSAAVAPLGYRRAVVRAAAASAALAAATLGLVAVVGTAVVAGAGTAVNDFAAAFSMRTERGAAFLAEVWVATALAALVAAFWAVVWLVEGRRHGYKRRRRTEAQIGNYRGIWAELREDFAVEGARPRGYSRVHAKEGRSVTTGVPMRHSSRPGSRETAAV